MTCVDADLATLRSALGHAIYRDTAFIEGLNAHDALARVEAELSRLREERDAALRESDWEKGQRLAAQVTLKAITDSLCLPLAELGDGWTDSTSKILARIEEIVDEGERGFRERDAAEARCARLQQALADLLDNGGWGHSHWDSTQQFGAGCTLCIAQREAKERAREALAGPDTPADSQEDEWFIPEGDRQCGVVHKMARATCMKRRGHDGSHATPQGTWIDGPWCEYPADRQEEGRA